jgi:hypothetical protein
MSILDAFKLSDRNDVGGFAAGGMSDNNQRVLRQQYHPRRVRSAPEPVGFCSWQEDTVGELPKIFRKSEISRKVVR